MSLLDEPDMAFIVRPAVVEMGVATSVQAEPFHCTAVATDDDPLKLFPIAHASVGEKAWTCCIAPEEMELGIVIGCQPLPFQRKASGTDTQPAAEFEFRVPLPTAITSLAESPPTPVSTQPFSNTLHGPDGSALRDHEAPFQWSICGLPESWPTAHTLVAEMAVMALSGTYGTLSVAV
jgi:hypothetical protein